MVDSSFLHDAPFYELAALLALAALVGFVGQRLRQPMIVSFIAAGILAGPSALNLVRSHESVNLLAELGVAVLLFLVGLKLDLKLIRSLGVISLATGLGQVLFTSLIGFFIGLALGLDTVTSLYVAVALTFSSTIIIVKLLSDKKEVDSLHGRIALGFLIVQDLVVVFAMMVLSAFGVGGELEGSVWHWLGQVVLQGVLLVGLVLLFIRYLAAPLMERVAHSTELLIVFSIAWATLLAALGSHFGFSKELGGLLAGVSLASTPFREAIVSRLSSLRDFLLLFFFIALGAQLDLSLLGAQVGPALVFSLFVLIGNPFIVLAIMGAMGFRKRTGFLAGLTVAQISEFSLIFIAMGVSLGHVGQGGLGLVTLVGLVTIALSVYMITYSGTLYRWLEPLLTPFERKHPAREDRYNSGVSSSNHDTILFGAGRLGSALARDLAVAGHSVLVVDFNPDTVRRLRERGIPAMYGDACDQDFLHALPLAGVKWVVATMQQRDQGLSHHDPRLVLLEGLRACGFTGGVALATDVEEESQAFTEAGADLVLLPFRDTAYQAVERMYPEDGEAGRSRMWEADGAEGGT